MAFHRELLLVAFALLQASHALYFHIAETERKCFIEEIPDETMVIGNYKVQLYDPNTKQYGDYPSIGMHVEVKDPEEKVILSKLYTSEGRFTFTSHTPGEHLICLYSNSSAWFSGSQLRVHLDIQVGEHAQDYEKVRREVSRFRLSVYSEFRLVIDWGESENEATVDHFDESVNERQTFLSRIGLLNFNRSLMRTKVEMRWSDTLVLGCICLSSITAGC
ncbi:hypothetical protein L596_021960 [Steinernema carpocapsae]|uniref:GOLD domain-containing protein n=1 Tax=Steinernema carpocapsae TaxID=34508 RepID=A0A4V6XVW9_STECR|nr:hypothetical protein L596_021960 [Steinernema carpocapsae]